MEDLASAIASLQKAADIFDGIGLENYRDIALQKIDELQADISPQIVDWRAG
ncbi:MAG TPA: hypothetical protein IGR64_11730 [Leptolyngbyaceae cyanobacterium M65_K2018_010]|nr:hypothetical protein [Leptolyngbyaceae cyanobacterium M65_K2018_010]